MAAATQLVSADMPSNFSLTASRPRLGNWQSFVRTVPAEQRAANELALLGSVNAFLQWRPLPNGFFRIPFRRACNLGAAAMAIAKVAALTSVIHACSAPHCASR